MSRTKLLLVAAIVIVLGLLAGWWLFGMGYRAPVSPVTQESASSSAPPRITSGYCCPAPGEACIEVDTAAACFSQGGKGFNTRLATCTNFCTKIGLLQKK